MTALAQNEQRLQEFEQLREEAYRLNDEKKEYDEALRTDAVAAGS